MQKVQKYFMTFTDCYLDSSMSVLRRVKWPSGDNQHMRNISLLNTRLYARMAVELGHRTNRWVSWSSL